MDNLNALNSRIKAIKNIKKITKAMEVIALTNMHKFRKIVIENKKYMDLINGVLSNLSLSKEIYQHKYFDKKYSSCFGYLIISSNHGLVGGLNTNLFRIACNSIKKNKYRNIESKIAVIGSKGISYFSKFKIPILAFEKFKISNIKFANFIGIIRILLNYYEKDKISKIFIVNNEFIDNFNQYPKISQILPLKIDKLQGRKENKLWDYIYEPNFKSVFNSLIKRYIESKFYKCILSSIISEQSARMISMKIATDNSTKCIKELNLKYNKIRQNNITKEIIEIISGNFTNN